MICNKKVYFNQHTQQIIWGVILKKNHVSLPIKGVALKIVLLLRKSNM